MIQNIVGQGTADIWNGEDTKAARKLMQREVWKVAIRKLDQLHAATRLDDMRVPPSNMMERLKSDGRWAVRINDRYRLLFRMEGADSFDVEIMDYH